MELQKVLEKLIIGVLLAYVVIQFQISLVPLIITAFTNLTNLAGNVIASAVISTIVYLLVIVGDILIVLKIFLPKMGRH